MAKRPKKKGKGGYSCAEDGDTIRVKTIPKMNIESGVPVASRRSYWEARDMTKAEFLEQYPDRAGELPC